MGRENSIKKNFAYSSILTISSYLFPLITFPYVTRVLGVDNLGICNFFDSIIQNFILFSMMGIGTIAIREVAKAKEDPIRLKSVFSSLLILNLLTTLLALIVLVVLSFTVDEFVQHKEMMYIGAAKVLFNSLLIEWFYKGLEDFQYITFRTIIVRAGYVLLVFALVKVPGDYVIYFSLNVAMVVINAIINFVHSKKFTSFTINNLCIRPFIKPFLILGVYSLLTSMYTSFNVVYLGFEGGKTEVGYYTTATKLYALILSFFTAFTGVMMPRMSSLLAEGNKIEFLNLTSKSIDVVLSFIIPLIIIGSFYAKDIIYIIAGEGYEGAILPMQILMPLLFISAYEQIIIIQMLMPLKKDKAILVNSIVGAIVGLLLNIILVPFFKSVGSSIVWLGSELAVMISAHLFISKYVHYNFPFVKILKRLLLYLPLYGVCYVVNRLGLLPILSIILVGCIIYSYVAVVEFYIMKNDVVIGLVNKIGCKFKR